MQRNFSTAIMVAAVTTSSCENNGAYPKSRSSLYHSGKDKASINEAASGGQRSGSKEIAQSYIASPILFSSKSNSSCIPAISSSSSSSSISFATPPRCESVDLYSNATARTVSRSTTRSLSVSFQDKSFFIQTKKAELTPRKPTVECQKVNAVGIENTQSDRWLKTTGGELNSTTGGLDSSTIKEHSHLETFQLLDDSVVFEEVVDFNIDVGTESLDSGCFSSVSKSTSPESEFQANVQAKARGICVPARFRQVIGWPQPHAQSPAKMVTGKRQILSSTQMASPRFVTPSPCGLVNSSSSTEIGVSRLGRNMERYSNGRAVNAPSIISFAYEVRKRKKGESRIEDAHLLRLLHNRYLQWRYNNARAEHTISTQMINAKNKLYHAWMTISELRDSAINKRIKLQVLRQKLKIASILKGQIVYLEESSTYDEAHGTFKGCIEALKASTLRVPVTGGAKVNIKEVKEAVHSAIGAVQLTMASICSLLSQVERISSLVVELGKLAAHEQAILNQIKHLLSIIAALHVRQSSLQSYILQLQRNKK